MARQVKSNGTTLFLKEVLLKPWQIGAIAPSSRNLAMAMARWLPDQTQHYVLELGPGTGAVTQALLDRGLAPQRLIAVEKSPQLARHLQQRFPKVKVITGDALELPQLLAHHAKNCTPFPMVFSSLPLCNFPAETAHRLTQILLSLMTADGRLVQYSYRLGIKRAESMQNLRYLTSSLVWWNLPPARVSVYQR
jgi:phosphatidylethanolamine/phosphatidyl-N-methylethanolamine N-methyltransferase